MNCDKCFLCGEEINNENENKSNYRSFPNHIHKICKNPICNKCRTNNTTEKLKEKILSKKKNLNIKIITLNE